MGYAQRIRLMAISGVVGWSAGFLCSMPAQVALGYRNSEGVLGVFVENTLLGLVVWGIWTLLLAVAAWLIIALPCALLLKPRFLVRFRQIVLTATLLTAVGFVLYRLYPYQDGAAAQTLLRFAIGLPYGSFAIFFAIVTAWWYLRGVARYSEATERLDLH